MKMVICILLESSEPDARCVDLEFSSKNGLIDSIGYGTGTTKNGIFG